MTDWNKFDPSEYDERQKAVKTKGTVAALSVFAALCGVNAIITDFYRWTYGYGAVGLFFEIAVSVYMLYIAANGAFHPANYKELRGNAKEIPVFAVITFMVLAAAITALLLSDGENTVNTANGQVMLKGSSVWLIGSLIFVISGAAAELVYRHRRKAEEQEDCEERE